MDVAANSRAFLHGSLILCPGLNPLCGHSIAVNMNQFSFLENWPPRWSMSEKKPMSLKIKSKMNTLKEVIVS